MRSMACKEKEYICVYHDRFPGFPFAWLGSPTLSKSRDIVCPESFSSTKRCSSSSFILNRLLLSGR